VLDQLLWHRKQAAAGSNSSSNAPDGSGGSGGGTSGTFRSWLSRLLLEMTLGRLDVQLQDCRCQFVVPWQLGPQSQLPAQQAQQQFDGAALSIRLLTVSPSNAAASPGGVQGASLHEALGKLISAASAVIVTAAGACFPAIVHEGLFAARLAGGGAAV
jgi:hypothetical protein